MNLEEARKVLWLKSNPRPLGELLHEGYLDQARLEWAAQWAFNSNLKQAARVILESMKTSPLETKVEKKPKSVEVQTPVTSLEIGITLDKARTTIWPFAPYKGQLIGSLVDSKQLSLKDLGYAVENVWDEKVRWAAIALSLVRLEQVVKEPVPDAGFVKIISGGRSFSERRESLLTLVQGFTMGIIMTLSIMVLISSLKRSDQQPIGKTVNELVSTPNGIIGFIIGMVILIVAVWLFNLLFNLITKRLDQKIEEYQRGQDGEDQTVQSIAQAFDGNWHLFRNVHIPGRNRGDLDIVLVGPPGVWVLEVKNFNGTYRNIGETWELMRKKKWKSAYANPSRQANNNSLRLKNFLKADNLNIFVNPAVVWANPESALFIENPSVAIWQYNRLPDELGNIWHGEKLTQEERTKIVDKLSKLCERQKLPKK